jgi:hypothetical protein
VTVRISMSPHVETRRHCFLWRMRHNTDVVLRHAAYAFIVHRGEQLLGVAVSLIGGPSVPRSGLCGVLRNAEAFGIHCS